MLAGRSAGMAEPPSRMVRHRATSTRPSSVGTSETCVAPRRAASSIAAASARACTSSRAPVHRARVITEKPPTWDNGRQASHHVSPATPVATEVAYAAYSMLRWVCTAPLGAPVVPDVAMTSASPSSTGRPPSSDRVPPSASTTCVAPRATITRSRWARGAPGSSGSTASPASHALRTAATKRSPPGSSSAVSSCTAPACHPRRGTGHHPARRRPRRLRRCPTPALR